MELSHLTIVTEGRHPLFPTEAGLRRAIHALARVSHGLLTHFCIVDDHVHLVALCPRPAAGRLAQAVAVSLGRLAGLATVPAHLEKVKDRRHLENLLAYLLRQPARHGLPVHPALWSGSSFLDLVGARVVPELRLRLREALPRTRKSTLAQIVGLDATSLRPMTPEDIRRTGAPELATTAAAALAAPPDLATRQKSVIDARAVTVHLAREAGIPNSDVTDTLRIGKSTLWRLARLAPPPRVPEAVRIALSLRAAARTSPVPASAPAG